MLKENKKQAKGSKYQPPRRIGETKKRKSPLSPFYINLVNKEYTFKLKLKDIDTLSFLEDK